MGKTGDRVLDWPAEHGLEARYVTAPDGARLRVLVGGNPRGERLLLVHGFPQNAACWRRVIALVRDDFRVMALDQRGYAGSDLSPSGRYDLSLLASDLACVLEQTAGEGAGGPAVLCVHDWGGPPAWHLLAERPELCARLVATSAPHLPAYLRALKRDPAQRRAAWYTAFFQLPGVEYYLSAGGGARLVDVLRRTSAPGTFSDEDIELYIGPLRDVARCRAALGYYRHGRRGSDAVLTTPTTILVPTRDKAVRRVIMDIVVERYCPGAEIVDVEGASHWVPDERPEAIAGALRAG